MNGTKKGHSATVWQLDPMTVEPQRILLVGDPEAGPRGKSGSITIGDLEGYLMSRLEERLHLREELTALHQHIDDDSHFRKGERLTLVTAASLQNQLRGMRQAITRLQEAVAKLGQS